MGGVKVSFHDDVKRLWDTWNIRGMIIVSLSLQTFLILFAPLRKQHGGKWRVRVPLWFAYMIADWVATFTIGLILQAESTSDVMALWAPFLLLHLGGPDTITSFSLEDNEFWIRHLLGLMLQVCFTLYIISNSLLNNKLWLPTFLVLIGGIIKYVERNCALYLASFDHFGGKRAELSEDSYLEEGWRYVRNDNLLSNFFLRKELYGGLIKSSIAGHLITPDRRYLSRIFFLRMASEPKRVLQTIEIELSLLYEALHTKFPVVESKMGYIFRITSLCCIFGALSSFIAIKKPVNELHKFDLRLTYVLLLGAIALDLISIRFFTLSDFHVFQRFSYWKDPLVVAKSSINNQRSRLSRNMYQLNFIAYYVRDDHPFWWNRLADFPSLRTTLEGMRGKHYLSSKYITENHTWDFIVDELRKKAELADTVQKGKEICLRRGDGVLDSNSDLFWSVHDLDCTESFLTWHIATEIFFQVQDQDPPQHVTAGQDVDHRLMSKVLSDYMFYLVEMQPTMMNNVFVDSKLMREDTCRHIEEVLKNYRDKRPRCEQNSDGQLYYHESGHYLVFYKKGREHYATKGGVCGKLFAMEKALIWGRWVLPGKSVLLKVRKLVARLLDNQQKNGDSWKLMSQVWIEMMCYAAINCQSNVHANQISQGGQLLTFVWLLMNHLGLGTSFSRDKEVSRDEDRTF